jgi:hypothetical protein
MKNTFLIIFLISVFTAVSQNPFENGYFIKNDGTKINCFVRPLDWSTNPVTFQYKLTEDAKTEIGKIENVKEFGTDATSKFIRTTVAIDQSSEAIANLTYDRNPDFKEETLFVKVLVEGKASLFFTSRETKNRFYYTNEDGEIEQLIFKSYMVTRSKKGENNRYKQQLATTLKCDNLDVKEFEKLEYKTKDLIHIFETYNTCVDSYFISFEKKKEKELALEKVNYKGKLNLSLRPGVTFSSYYTTTDIQREDFENKTGYRIGLELEYLFPSKNRNWAIFIEPSYRNYESEKEVLYVDFYSIQKYTTITVKKNSIDIITGPRYYFNLNKKSSIFVDVSLLIDTNINSEETSSEDLGYYNNMGIDLGNSFGLGYRYNEKLSLQCRYNNYGSTFSSSSVVLGYNFL